MAALVAYYAFFSLFPLLLAATTILGYVAKDSPRLREQLINSALGQIPVIGTQLQSDRGLDGSAVALTVGVAGALWAGQGAMLAAQDAMNSIWSVARVDYPTFAAKRLRALFALAVIGGGLVAAVLLANLTNMISNLPLVTTVLLVLTNLGVDMAIFLGAFVTLTTAGPSWKALVPGAIVAGVAYYLLQVVGSYYVTRSVRGAADAYGTFAVVIGLLAWLHLQAQLTMLAAEVNVVIDRRLWPRGLTDREPTAADLEVLRARAASERGRHDQTVDVQFANSPDLGADETDEHNGVSL